MCFLLYLKTVRTQFVSRHCAKYLTNVKRLKKQLYTVCARSCVTRAVRLQKQKHTYRIFKLLYIRRQVYYEVVNSMLM